MVAPGGIHVGPLQVGEIPLAYPLIQLATPGVTAEQWRLFALAVLGAPDAADGRRGLLGARSGRGDLLGCCCYALHPDLHDGGLVEASHLAAFDIAGRSAVLAALLEALSGLARQSGCGRLRVTLPSAAGLLRLASDGAADALQAAGLAPEAVCLGTRVRR